VCLSGSELELRNPCLARARRVVPCDLLCAVECHLSVDEIALRGRPNVSSRLHDFVNDITIRSVIPILEEDRSKIDVVVGVLWSIDNHRPQEATFIKLETAYDNGDVLDLPAN
jgi:hypothetical protein